ncbi:MAG: hypothetical protein AAB403_00780, partial [Planctomycetota bacterium]
MIAKYDNLSRAARIGLLGHYLSKMVTLMHAAELEEREITAQRRAEGTIESSTAGSIPTVALSKDSQAIVTYLKRAGSASAREINRYGGIARSSMFR